MGDLSCFLAQNAAKVETVKYVASKRFVGADKKPVEWEIKAIASKQDGILRKECTKKIPVVGRKGQYAREVDYDAYLSKLAVICTVYPNLNDKELQDSYHVMGAEDLLTTMLTAGEYANFIEKVQHINGFDESMDELVDEAKN